jgi:hypothetical protein
MRHQLTDKIQKLERDLEASEHNIAKLSEEVREKDNMKDKQKEEYERRIRNYEGHVINRN